MKFKMSDKSLFAMLLRAPWWVSFVVAGLVGMAGRLLFPADMVVFGLLAGFPFAVIGCIAAVRQWRAPSAAMVESTMQAIGAMSWKEFSGVMEEALRRDGFLVKPLQGGVADFVAAKVGTHALVSCKRWKAAKPGVEQLRELAAAVQAHEDAREGVFVTIGEVSSNAQEFAAANRIQILQGPVLAQLLKGIVVIAKPAR